MRGLFAMLALLVVCGPAAAFDPLGSRTDLLDLTPPGQVPLDAELNGGVRCPEPFAGGDISLSEVVRRALCRDPRAPGLGRCVPCCRTPGGGPCRLSANPERQPDTQPERPDPGAGRQHNALRQPRAG